VGKVTLVTGPTSGIGIAGRESRFPPALCWREPAFAALSPTLAISPSG
jgi:hypothetical protein